MGPTSTGEDSVEGQRFHSCTNCWKYFQVKSSLVLSHLSHFGILLKKWKSLWTQAFQYFPDLNIKYFPTNIQTWSRIYFKRRLHRTLLSVKKSTFEIRSSYRPLCLNSLEMILKNKNHFSFQKPPDIKCIFHYLSLAFTSGSSKKTLSPKKDKEILKKEKNAQIF